MYGHQVVKTLIEFFSLNTTIQFQLYLWMWTQEKKHTQTQTHRSNVIMQSLNYCRKKVASKRGLQQQQQQQKNRRLFNNGSTPQLCTDSMVKWP